MDFVNCRHARGSDIGINPEAFLYVISSKAQCYFFDLFIVYFIVHCERCIYMYGVFLNINNVNLFIYFFGFTGCSGDESRVELAEISGGASVGGGGGEGGSAKQEERCPQCGILCRNLHVLQLHLEDAHKTTFAIDKHDLGAQFSQVVGFFIIINISIFFIS